MKSNNDDFDLIYKKDILDIELSVDDPTSSEAHIDVETTLTDIVSETFLFDYAKRLKGGVKLEFMEMVEDFIHSDIIGTYLSKRIHENFYEVEDEMETIDSLSNFIRNYFVCHSHLHIELIAELEFWWKPLNFEEIFRTYFAFPLSLRGVNDIRVTQSVTGDDVAGFDYDVIITSHEMAYRMKSSGDRDLLEPFALIINKLLLHKPLKDRFVRSIDTGDVGYLFIEPDAAIRCLSPYGFRLQALK